jgi:hypothetical protein
MESSNFPLRGGGKSLIYKYLTSYFVCVFRLHGINTAIVRLRCRYKWDLPAACRPAGPGSYVLGEGSSVSGEPLYTLNLAPYTVALATLS